MNRIEMKERTERRTKKDVRSLVEEFMAANTEVMQVPWTDVYKSPYICANSINRSAESAGRKSQCKAVVRHKNVFLLNLSKHREEELKEAPAKVEEPVTPPSFSNDKTDSIAFMEVDPSAVNKKIKRKQRKGKYEKLIEEFIDSDIAVANVPWKRHATSVKSMGASIRHEIRKLNMGDLVKVTVRDGNLYLVNIPKFEAYKKEAE